MTKLLYTYRIICKWKLLPSFLLPLYHYYYHYYEIISHHYYIIHYYYYNIMDCDQSYFHNEVNFNCI